MYFLILEKDDIHRSELFSNVERVFVKQSPFYSCVLVEITPLKLLKNRDTESLKQRYLGNICFQ